MTPAANNVADIQPQADAEGRSLGGLALRAAPWVIIILGISLRLMQYSHDRSLFLDEAFIAKNITDKSYSELLRSLEFDQRAPAAFLLAVKASCLTIGPSDLVLRLTPLAAGIAAMGIFYLMARGFVDRPAALLATLFFALADTQIFYSSDLKQYSLDVLVVICILWAFAGYQRRPLTPARALGLGLLGAVALWCSFPATIMLAGVGACVGIRELAGRRWSQVAWLIVVALLWAIGFGAVYFFQLRYFESNPSWKEMWANDFMPLPLWRDHWIKWLYERIKQFLTLGVGLKYGGLALLAFLIGLWGFWKQNRFKLFLLISPLLVAIVISALRIYPFGGRVCLYFAPPMALLMAEGICFLHRSIPGACRWVATAMAVLLLIYPVEMAASAMHGNLYGNRMFFGYKLEETKPLMRYIQQHWQPGDLVYLYGQSNVAFEHYAERFGFQPEDSVRGIETGMMNPQWSEIREDLEKLRGRKRVWVFFSHITPVDNGVDELVLYLNFLDDMGHRLDQLDMPSNCNAALYLYDLKATTDSHK